MSKKWWAQEINVTQLRQAIRESESEYKKELLSALKNKKGTVNFCSAVWNYAQHLQNAMSEIVQDNFLNCEY